MPTSAADPSGDAAEVGISLSAEVRDATPLDAAALAELAAATFPLACPPGTTPEAVAEFLAANLSEPHFRRYLADPQQVLMVAEDSGGLVGYTLLVLGDPADEEVASAVTVRPTAELSKIYVRPSAHGGGMAAALLDVTLQRATAAGVAGVWLGVNQRNVRAQRFYAKSGFAVAGERSFRVGPDLHRDHVMVRVLA
ncbi:MAG TPA: GNAT family N-acetyltransferase [Naasia sp.]